MVKITFARGAKTIEVLDDVYSKEEAEAVAGEHRTQAFGFLASIRKAFEKQQKQILLTGYQKLYIPFWHVVGESVQEYRRKSTYQFAVRPEVRSVTINKKIIPVDENEPVCAFEGIDHCYEQYSKTILQGAADENEKNLDRYLECKRKNVKNLDSVQGRSQTIVAPINTRASYLVNQLIKDLVKPIQADEILKEYVEITRLALVLRPVHVFEFQEEGSTARKTVEVDAITGAWRRGERLLTGALKKKMLSDGMFEIGSELAATVIPGAGVAAAIGRQLHRRQEHGRAVKQMQQWRKNYEQKRKK